MLTATSVSLFSWDYDIRRGEEPVTRLEVASTRDSGGFNLAGEPFVVSRDGFAGWFGSFQLTLGETPIATVERPSLFRRRYLIRTHSAAAAEPLAIAAAGWFTRAYRVSSGSNQLGTIRLAGWTYQTIHAEIDTQVPLPLQLFILWLVIINWRRDQQSSS